MINQNLLKPNPNDIFGSNLPMRKSIIITDNPLFIDLDKSTSTIRKRTQRKTEVFETRKSSAIISSITYPSQIFLARKLKRIMQFHLNEVFTKLKNHRTCRINLNLLQNKTKRFMSSAFFSIQIFAQQHKGFKLDSVIEKNKKPNLLFYAVGRAVKVRQKQVLQQMNRIQLRNQNVCYFANLLDTFVRVQIKKYWRKMFLRKLKINDNEKQNKQEGTKNIIRLIPKVIKRIKIQSLHNIFSCLKRKQLEQVNTVKKNFSHKMNQTTSQRSKILNSHRQSIRNIKNDLDYFSADRSKARYEIKRQIGVQKNKLKDDQKKSKIVINELNKEICQVESKLVEIKDLNFKRLQRIQSRIGEEEVRKIYLSLSQQEVNKVGEIKPKILTKQRVAQYQNQVQKLDEYHIYHNQRLRQQVFEYEGLTVYKSRWPQEQVVHEQNATLKQLIGCLVGRSLEKMLRPEELQHHAS